MTVEQNVGAGLAGNKKKKQEQVQKMIRHFRLEGLEKDFRESFPAGSSRELRWRGSWHTNHPLFSSMNHFRHWMSS